MIGQRTGIVAGNVLELGDIDQKIGQFIGAGGQAFDRFDDGRVVLEQRRIMYPYHAGAGTGWQDHVIAAIEFLEDLQRQRFRGLLVSRVVTRLAAAGLGRWYYHFTTGRLQQTQCREPDARPHQVHEAGDEQASAHAGSFYIVYRRFVQHTPLRIMKGRARDPS